MLKTRFRPEFLNRIDEIILFHCLDNNHIAAILGLELEKLNVRLRERRLNLRLDHPALDLLARIGYDPLYGARPRSSELSKT